jgi:hypothetical protein
VEVVTEVKHQHVEVMAMEAELYQVLEAVEAVELDLAGQVELVELVLQALLLSDGN